MDTAEKVMLAGLGALAVGVLIGWHLRLERKRGGAVAAANSQALVKADAPAAPSRYHIPVGGADAGCGCS